ncbi:hypothetical protein EW145_g6704 [Phellinidium pouzarii]|uniref:glutathione peroxidase n=1 Tax=Phellinidium pouzarii TaxID=167371 RepID=A0A4S4KXC9_9AGAM|nr:hypothetical protein EW145_g6704 [Phellinidium pouzarii]
MLSATRRPATSPAMLSFIRNLLFSRQSTSSTSVTDVKAFVNNVIESNRIAVFSKSYCPYCRNAKSLLHDTYGGVPATVLELDQRDDGNDIQDYLLEKTGQRTVPSIFIDQRHIGGSNDLAKLENEGNLNDLIYKEGPAS